ncbi:MAG: hypothetical protein WAU88_02460 [Candidatus Zixiibacteriota bacterium]
MKEAGIRLITFVFSLMLAVTASGGDLLKFNPPASVSLKVTSRTIRVESRNGLRLADTTVSEAAGKITRTAGGWAVTTTVKSIRITPGTDSLKKTLSDLLIGTETSLYINSQGMALSASGYDQMLARLDSGVQTPMKSAIRQVFTPRALAEREQREWNVRVGEIVGRPLTIGHIETRRADNSAEAGPRVSLLSATIIEDTIRLDGVLCLQVGVYSDSDPARLADALHRSVPEVVALFHLSDSAVAGLKQREMEYSSHLHITMDAATLLVRAETMERTMTVAVPGKDGTTNKRQTQETVEKAISYY